MRTGPGPAVCYDAASPHRFSVLPNNFDLHNHTLASDGLCTPGELIALAAGNGCDAIALTDHDTVAALDEADAAARAAGIGFIRGVEISVSWAPDGERAATTLHVVGLGIDPLQSELAAGLEQLRVGRVARAQRIGEEFERIGIAGLFDSAWQLADNKSMIGRTHFARALVARGEVKDTHAAFQRYLIGGKPGFVAHRWAALNEAVAWIVAAGGIAVMAHPGRYKLTRAEMSQLLAEFKALGGRAIEVVTGSHRPAQYLEYAALAREFGFLASRGADFHGVGESHFEPGTLPPLPADLTPVWTALA